MPIDDAESQRLAAFCAKLPELPADVAQARKETLFALECFAKRRLELEEQLNEVESSGSLSALRCEIDAFEAGRKALDKFWLAQFGSALCD